MKKENQEIKMLKAIYKKASIDDKNDFFFSLKEELKFQIEKMPMVEERQYKWHTFKMIAENYNYLDFNLKTVGILITIFGIMIGLSHFVASSSLILTMLFAFLLFIACIAIYMQKQENMFKYIVYVLNAIEEDYFNK